MVRNLTEMKQHKIRTFKQLGKLINEENQEDLLKCFVLSLLAFKEAKQKEKKLSFVGMNWIDDGKNEITKIDVIKSK
jgi:hypothetical protein